MKNGPSIDHSLDTSVNLKSKMKLKNKRKYMTNTMTTTGNLFVKTGTNENGIDAYSLASSMLI